MPYGYFVEDTADFDANAFRLPPGEALALDPQARIALEQTQVSQAGPNPDVLKLPVAACLDLVAGLRLLLSLFLSHMQSQCF